MILFSNLPSVPQLGLCRNSRWTSRLVVFASKCLPLAFVVVTFPLDWPFFLLITFLRLCALNCFLVATASVTLLLPLL